MSDRHRVVFDCNTYLQALAAPDGPAGRCIQLAFDGVVEFFISPDSMAELRDVTSRTKVIARLRLTTSRTEEFLLAIEAAATVLSGFPELFAYERDPDDSLYVNLALAADAHLIVSRDRDLLDLMDITKPEAAGFQRRYPWLRILDPVGFLREIESS